MHPSALQQTGYAPVNGLRMYYEIRGPAGQLPLVLLHGGGDTIETSFGHLLPVLARSRRIVAFEQQGCGRTTDIEDRPFSFEQSADDTAALLKHLNIEPRRSSWFQQRRHNFAAGGDAVSAAGSPAHRDHRAHEAGLG